MNDDYNAQDDGEKSYYAAIAAKKARGDHLIPDRVYALEQNLLSLERIVHDLQKDLQDIKKALRDLNG